MLEREESPFSNPVLFLTELDAIITSFTYGESRNSVLGFEKVSLTFLNWTSDKTLNLYLLKYCEISSST